MSGLRMLFHRDFLEYTGGHGKVWDYFNHALALGWDARVFLTSGSLRDERNPWMTMPERIAKEWRPDQADVLFLAGMDWLALPPQPAHAPVINLVQGVRHAQAGHPLRRFLGRPALRICVSQAVAETILATGEVQGRIRVVPAAVQLPDLPAVSSELGAVFIGALKDPVLGTALAVQLRDRGYAVELAQEWIPRQQYLRRLQQASIAVLLPHQAEGFYLPGLEAMALGVPVVMPHCLGNGEYAHPYGNCLMPERDIGGLAAAVAYLDNPAARARMVTAGRATAVLFTQDRERASFASLLKEILP